MFVIDDTFYSYHSYEDEGRYLLSSSDDGQVFIIDGRATAAFKPLAHTGKPNSNKVIKSRMPATNRDSQGLLQYVLSLVLQTILLRNIMYPCGLDLAMTFKFIIICIHIYDG